MSLIPDDVLYMGVVAAAAVVFVIFGAGFALGYWVAS